MEAISHICLCVSRPEDLRCGGLWVVRGRSHHQPVPEPHGPHPCVHPGALGAHGGLEAARVCHGRGEETEGLARCCACERYSTDAGEMLFSRDRNCPEPGRPPPKKKPTGPSQFGIDAESVPNQSLLISVRRASQTDSEPNPNRFRTDSEPIPNRTDSEPIPNRFRTDSEPIPNRVRATFLEGMGGGGESTGDSGKDGGGKEPSRPSAASPVHAVFSCSMAIEMTTPSLKLKMSALASNNSFPTLEVWAGQSFQPESEFGWKTSVQLARLFFRIVGVSCSVVVQVRLRN